MLKNYLRVSKCKIRIIKALAPLDIPHSTIPHSTVCNCVFVIKYTNVELVSVPALLERKSAACLISASLSEFSLKLY